MRSSIFKILDAKHGVSGRDKRLRIEVTRERELYEQTLFPLKRGDNIAQIGE